MAAEPRPQGAKKKSRRGWLVLAVIIGVLILGGILARVALPLLVIAVLLIAGLGLFTLFKGAAPRLGMRSRKSGFAALGAAALLFLGGGVAGAATSAPSQPPAAFVDTVPKLDATAQVERSTPTPKPTPTTFEEVYLDTAIPFERITADDPTIAEGTTAVTTAGVDGTKRTTYRVMYVDGAEVSREVISEAIVLAPLAEVTTRGTLKPQPVTKPAPLVQTGGGGCDSNYAGACVPIAEDVDCVGGGGNGPAFLSGTAQVVGRDVYQLDRNKDGIACN